MAVAPRAKRGIFIAVLLSLAVLGGCGGGGEYQSELMRGTAAVGEPLAGSTVRLRCSDGSELRTTTSNLGIWQIVVKSLALPCALQVSGGVANSLPNTTAYHTLVLGYGLHNTTPLTDLITAQALGEDPQTWFASPVFTKANASQVNAALATVTTELGMQDRLGQRNPITDSFGADSTFFVLDRVLVAIPIALRDPSVNKSYADLLAAAIANELALRLPGFGAAFATAYDSL